MIIVSIATERNNYVKEFEQRLTQLKYTYKLLGLGKPWEGYISKTKWYLEFLKALNTNELIVVCDSYDLLFVRYPNELNELYNKRANGKLVVGVEPTSEAVCNIIPNCNTKTVKDCKITNTVYKDYKYPNSGFMMGYRDDLIDVYQFIKQQNISDDQEGLHAWLNDGNCDRCYFDTKLEFVFNYYPPVTLIFKKDRINVQLIINKNKKQIKVNNTFPCVIHMQAQNLDFGKRSEKIRNFLINGRVAIPWTVYAGDMYKKACSVEVYYIGYWWWVIVIVIIALLLFKYKKYK